MCLEINPHSLSTPKGWRFGEQLFFPDLDISLNSSMVGGKIFFCVEVDISFNFKEKLFFKTDPPTP